MSVHPIVCTRCNTVIDERHYNQRLVKCLRCGDELRVDVFPAFFRSSTGSAAGGELLEGESSCFFHPRKKAELACGNCGRLICSLCEIELAGQRLCPTCVESGKRKGRITALENHRVLYDNIVLDLALLPLLIFWLTLLTAPLAWFFLIKYWRTPCSILPRTRIRFVVGGLLATAQIVGWILLFVYLISAAWK